MENRFREHVKDISRSLEKICGCIEEHADQQAGRGWAAESPEFLGLLPMRYRVGDYVIELTAMAKWDHEAMNKFDVSEICYAFESTLDIAAELPHAIKHVALSPESRFGSNYDDGVLESISRQIQRKMVDSIEVPSLDKTTVDCISIILREQMQGLVNRKRDEAKASLPGMTNDGRLTRSRSYCSKADSPDASIPSSPTDNRKSSDDDLGWGQSKSCSSFPQRDGWGDDSRCDCGAIDTGNWHYPECCSNLRCSGRDNRHTNGDMDCSECGRYDEEKSLHEIASVVGSEDGLGRASKSNGWSIPEPKHQSSTRRSFPQRSWSPSVAHQYEPPRASRRRRSSTVYYGQDSPILHRVGPWGIGDDLETITQVPGPMIYTPTTTSPMSTQRPVPAVYIVNMDVEKVRNGHHLAHRGNVLWSNGSTEKIWMHDLSKKYPQQLIQYYEKTMPLNNKTPYQPSSQVNSTYNPTRSNSSRYSMHMPEAHPSQYSVHAPVLHGNESNFDSVGPGIMNSNDAIRYPSTGFFGMHGNNTSNPILGVNGDDAPFNPPMHFNSGIGNGMRPNIAAQHAHYNNDGWM